MPTYNYQQSVEWLRQQPNRTKDIELGYLDKDNLAAAHRFMRSEEFIAVCYLLGVNKVSKTFKILDLGCGNGIASYAFASLGHNVYAVDPDLSDDVGLKAAERLASTLKQGSLTTYQAFAESLPFSENNFDIVYARQALHHFSSLNDGIAECFRVLKPKGLLFATREHVVSDEYQLETFLENHILHKLHGGENAYALEVYKAAFELSGFKLMRVFAPFDTVINHFPVSNNEIKDWLHKSLTQKLNPSLASILVHLPLMEDLFRSRLSSSCNTPGRLYSFLASK